MTLPPPLERRFYEPDAARVAPALLGHFLLVGSGEEVCGGIIVETEAYLADDPASHGYRRETARNRSMYGPAGHAYVYFIYGNHHCFNVVCRDAGIAEAVLVRAIAPVFGVEPMRRRRGGLNDRQLTNGPGKLCAALDIDRRHDGVDLCEPEALVRVAWNAEAKSVRRRLAPRVTGPRVGITKAAGQPLRFRLSGSPHCSRG